MATYLVVARRSARAKADPVQFTIAAEMVAGTGVEPATPAL